MFKNVTLDVDGNVKTSPRHILINDKVFQQLSPNVQQSNLKSFLSELNNVKLSDTMKTRTIFVSLFSLYTFAYPIHKWQNDSVPGLILTSIEPEAQKTTIMKRKYLYDQSIFITDFFPNIFTLMFMTQKHLYI